MDENLKKDIEKIVAAIFSEQEKADQIKQTQDALNESATTIENLTNVLEETKAEINTIKESAQAKETELIAAAEAKDAKILELINELEAARTKLQETENSLKASEESLENIKKDKIAEERINQLRAEKVASESDVLAQTARVRGMTDEEFATYKADRIELRNAVAKELESTSGETTTTTTATVTDPVVVVTTPANITPGQAMASALNFEIKPSDDMKNKYIELGKSLAENVLSSSKIVRK